MIGQCLSNKNKSATVSKSKNFLDLNKESLLIGGPCMGFVRSSSQTFSFFFSYQVSHPLIKTGLTHPFNFILHPPNNQTELHLRDTPKIISSKKKHKNLRAQDCTYHALYFNKDGPPALGREKKTYGAVLLQEKTWRIYFALYFNKDESYKMGGRNKQILVQ
jgi:hypothetical protein